MEILDLVDADDNPIAQCTKESYHSEKGLWIRSVTVFLIRSDGCCWVPTRASTKKLYPNCLDSSVAGHVQAGESYRQAALRETIEETGLNVASEDLVLIAVLSPLEHGTFCFTAVFVLLLRDQLPLVNPVDHRHAQWMTFGSLHAQLLRGAPARSDLLPILIACRPLLDGQRTLSLTP
jgi:8-oxo-dGTP pyrophosphatase MutT (NUDIX family)